MARAVAGGRARKVAKPITYIYIGVDEKAFRKGHRYHTIVCDLERSTVEFVAEDRETASLAAYYTSLTEEQRTAIKAVAMGMRDPSIRATREGLPDARASRCSIAFTSCGG
jgi:transposase